MKLKYNLLLFLFTFFSAISVSAEELLYLAAGDVLTIKRIDPQTGKLFDFQNIELPGLSSFTLARNKKFLYAQARMAGDRKKPSIATYKIAANGKLTFIYNALVSRKTTELKTDHTDKFLAGASYSKGTASIWQLDNGIYKGELVQEITLEKNSHAARFSPDNNMLYVPATGPNKIFQLAFEANTGKVTQQQSALGASAGASQPRHLVFHPTLNVAYTSQERLKPGVAVWHWSPEQGTLELAQTLTNSDDTSGRITNADLHISPDQKFLYLSSRDKKNQHDQIITYKINPINGSLKLVKKFPTEHFPRSFAINKTGDFIYVAGQKENKLGVYKIDKTTGHLTKVVQYETGNNPIWVEILRLN